MMQSVLIFTHVALCLTVAGSALYIACKSTSRTLPQVTAFLGLMGASYSYAIFAALWGALDVTESLLLMELGVAGWLVVTHTQWRDGSPPVLSRDPWPRWLRHR